VKLIGTVVAGYSVATAEHDDGVWEGFGYQPHPGTLNLRVDGALPGWLTSRRPARWRSDRPQHLTVFWPCMIGDVAGHVRANVTGPQIEAVAAVHLRTVLRLEDGDQVVIT
jgi:CTP-dependent riboflavin kinase